MGWRNQVHWQGTLRLLEPLGLFVQVRTVLSDATHGLRLDSKQIVIMQDCMQSLATSRD